MSCGLKVESFTDRTKKLHRKLRNYVKARYKIPSWEANSRHIVKKFSDCYNHQIHDIIRMTNFRVLFSFSWHKIVFHNKLQCLYRTTKSYDYCYLIVQPKHSHLPTIRSLGYYAAHYNHVRIFPRQIMGAFRVHKQTAIVKWMRLSAKTLYLRKLKTLW